MYAFFIVIHVIVCLVLILVVLLQAGRGGGMSDMMGGGQPNSLLGTQTNQFMTRATEVCAVVFIITSLALNFMTIQKSKSLMGSKKFNPVASSAAPATTALPVQADTKEAPAPVKAVDAAMAKAETVTTQEAAKV